jgi:tetratricopeptide (TPR) repeat protein
VELFLDVADALPARALEQAPVISLRASMHLERAGKLTHEAKTDEARAEYERALALLTPPRETMARVMRGDILCALQRWTDAVVEFEQALREVPEYLPQVRESALEAARGAFPSSLWASFLRPGQRPPSGTRAVAFLRSLVPTEERPSAERVAVLAAMARACHAQGDAVGAEGILRAAAEESPNETAVLFARAEWHAAAGRLEEARADLDAIPGSDNNTFLLRTVLEVEALLEAGKGAEGRKLIDDTLSRIEPQGNPWTIDVANHLRAQRARALQAGGGG